MNIKNLSIRWKVASLIMLSVTAGLLMMAFISGYKTKAIVVSEVRHSTLPGYRDTVLNALTTMMLAGTIKDTKGPFLDQMQNIVDLKVVRSDVFDKDFGKADSKEYASDLIEKEVIRSGKEIIIVEGAYVRGVYPYIARSNFMGKNCLSCHNVSEGTVLGAVDMRVPLTESLGRIKSLQYFYIAIGLAGVLVLMVLVLGIINLTLSPLTQLIEKVKRVGEGYTDTSLRIEGRDEIAQMSQSVDSVIRYFASMIRDIITASGQIMPAVEEVKRRAAATSEGAKSQAGQAHQIVASAEEMSQTITGIAKNASIASESSFEAMEIVEGGRQITITAVDTINEVSSSTTELSDMVKKLNNRVIEIGGILIVIKDIADQTNLLALNAAIEAARAGDQGRGFAVVADEVRKLAERTIQATGEITERIRTVQTESVQTAKSMEKSSKGVTRATGHIRNLENVLQTIVEAVQKVRDQITQIAAAVDQQSAASDQVTKTAEATSLVSVEMDRMIGEVTHEIEKLAGIADTLKTATAKIKT